MANGTRRTSRALRLALIVLAVAVGSVACHAATPEPEPLASESGAPAAAPQNDVDAVRRTIDAVNATAGGAVADQQRQLIALVDPARRAEVQRCPTPTTTVRLEPVDRGLRMLPGPTDSPAAQPPTGADARTYALPTLVRVYTGDRLTGTDLTTMQLTVRSGEAGSEAYLTPFCVN